jgi:small multidrug resistance family-3 protein
MAALLEVSGDALTRMGLRGRPMLLAAGGLTLFVYGVVVNQGRFDFGRLMGAYIAVFFLVSQVVAFAFFRDTPDFKTIAGGMLIIIGGAVIML